MNTKIPTEWLWQPHPWIGLLIIVVTFLWIFGFFDYIEKKLEDRKKLP